MTLPEIGSTIGKTPLPHGTEKIIERLDSVWQRQGWTAPTMPATRSGPQRGETTPKSHEGSFRPRQRPESDTQLS